MHDVKFGLLLPGDDYAAAKQAALQAESEGFYSVSMIDHFFTPLGPPETPVLECYTTLTAIAAVTERIRLTPCVTAVSFRTPPMLAKITSTLDHVSNGRLTLGLGAGWKPDECYAHGYPYPSNRERLDQLAEAISVIKAMWTQEEPSFQGTHFSIDKAYNNPRPVQKPCPPLMLGGSGSGLLKIAAAEADILNINPPVFDGKDYPNDPAMALKFDTAYLKKRISMLHGYMEQRGRDPKEIELGSLMVTHLSKDSGDPALAQTAGFIGFPDADKALQSPLTLMGTPDRVKRELHTRMEEMDLTYTIIIPISPESYELFVKEVMPEFV
jgi:probable F420-dependent oxidoreductase